MGLSGGYLFKLCKFRIIDGFNTDDRSSVAAYFIRRFKFNCSNADIGDIA